jgi:hypothetical protein
VGLARGELDRISAELSGGAGQQAAAPAVAELVAR